MDEINQGSDEDYFLTKVLPAIASLDQVYLPWQAGYT